MLVLTQHALNPVSSFITSYFPWLLIGILVFYMAQRRSAGTGPQKRLASLYWAGWVLACMIASYFIKRYFISDLFLIPPAIIAAVFVYRFRSYLFPYTRTCVSCGNSLSVRRILFFDSSLCTECDPPRSQKNPGSNL